MSAMSAPNRKIHIMQVTYGMVIGGLERVIIELCRHVDRSRYRLSICCISTRGPLADVIEAEGTQVIVCPKQTRPAKYLRGFELARIFRQQHVDLIHTHHTPAFVDATLGARFARIPLINTDHTKLYPTTPRWRLLEKHASRFAERVVAVSEQSKRDLIDYQGIAPEKLQVIYNGLDLKTPRQHESVSSLRQELGLAPDQIVIGTAARLEDQKGLDLLLDAVPSVLERLPHARFVIVGGGSQEQALRGQAARLGLGHAVTFTGPRVDAVDLMRAFDCFVQTSHWEGMPMALIEAMALSKPVVATAVGGVAELVEDHVTGLLVRNRDPRLFAEALVQALGDPEESQRLGKAGYARYASRFTSRAMIDQYERLYEQVLTQRRSGSRRQSRSQAGAAAARHAAV
jgi:glycosyltransferase involved in cell wall biosynthesis